MNRRAAAVTSRRRATRALGLGLGAVLGASVVAGCSSGPGSAGGTTSTSRPPATTTTPTSPTTATTATTTPTSTSAGVAGCQVAQLDVVPQEGSGAAGTIELSVELTNHSTTSCSLFGYPGMQLLDASGNDLPTDVIRGGGPPFPVAAANQGPTTVVLGAGQSAAFSLSYSDVPVGGETSCPTSAHALVTPPGDLTSATVALTIAPCGGGTVHVSPVYASA
ncbi:MAG TPA: DUF4232 domain-containing protein [Acidimicrobiales bacterium]